MLHESVDPDSQSSAPVPLTSPALKTPTMLSVSNLTAATPDLPPFPTPLSSGGGGHCSDYPTPELPPFPMSSGSRCSMNLSDLPLPPPPDIVALAEDQLAEKQNSSCGSGKYGYWYLQS